MAFLGKTLLCKPGMSIPNTLSFKTPLLIYFSASWCPPCRGFTPVLTDFYNAVNSPTKQCEIIFASLDQSDQEFKDYFSKMPWLAIQYEEKDLINQLAQKYSVQSIPSLVQINGKGESLISDCRSEVASKGVSALILFKQALLKGN